jgi:hypothetical protein
LGFIARAYCPHPSDVVPALSLDSHTPSIAPAGTMPGRHDVHRDLGRHERRSPDGALTVQRAPIDRSERPHLTKRLTTGAPYGCRNRQARVRRQCV